MLWVPNVTALMLLIIGACSILRIVRWVGRCDGPDKVSAAVATSRSGPCLADAFKRDVDDLVEPERCAGFLPRRQQALVAGTLLSTTSDHAVEADDASSEAPCGHLFRADGSDDRRPGRNANLCERERRCQPFKRLWTGYFRGALLARGDGQAKTAPFDDSSDQTQTEPKPAGAATLVRTIEAPRDRFAVALGIPGPVSFTRIAASPSR
jgi:hypothetical protein